ncbi:MAG: uroporphyrinogen decarboxylase family protein [Holophaga sp.]|nr:uroporphyrinogen decarboxylase family protein [Holophaga sp.]
MKESKMTHWERITAAIAGEPVDRVPVGLWRHFPVIDQDSVKVAEATIAWQRTYDFDILKYTPDGTYGVDDWGAVSSYLDAPGGFRVVTKPGLTSADAWPKLAKLSPTQGRLGREIKSISMVAEAFKGEVPLFATLFSPMTTAVKLAGERVFGDLRSHPELFEAGLATIAETTLAFARAALRAGVHGIFFASQVGSYRKMNEAEHRQFGVRYDRMVLDPLARECKFIMLHLHGDDMIFNQMLDYPVNMINWHDRHSEMTLAGGMGRFNGLLAGGLDHEGTLMKGSVEAIKEQVRDAITQTKGRRLMIAPGCVGQVPTPDANYRAVMEAVAEMAF